MTGITQKAILIVASVLAIIVAAPRRANADSIGIVLVTGKAAARERAVLESAIVIALRRASWSLSAQPFSPKETETITKCLRDDQPWRCLSPLMQPKGVDRIVIADANPSSDSAGKLVITGEFVIAGDGAAAVVQRRCDGCNDAQLTDVAEQLTEALLHDMAVRNEQTILELQTTPAGATVILDGRFIGVTNATGGITQTTYPGPHKLSVQHPGFVLNERTIDLPAGQTTTLVLALLRDLESEHLQYVPIVSAVAGVAALVGGGVLIYKGQQDGPDDRQRYTRATAIGIGTEIVGVAAIGYAAYLWWRGPKANALAMTTIPGGLVAGWAGTF
jgi:hypothetical protein